MFVALIACTFGVLRQTSRRYAASGDPRGKALTQALMASLIGFVVGAFFLSLAYAEMLYALIALAVGSYKVMVMNVTAAAARQPA